MELCIKLLVDEVRDRPSGLRLAEQVASGVADLNHLVTNILDYTRLPEPQLATTDLDALLDEVLAAAAPSVGRVDIAGEHPVASTFLVAPDLVIVPVHVADAFATRGPKGKWTLKKHALVRFDLTAATYDREIKSVLRTVKPDEENPDGGPWIDAQTLEICWPVLVQLKKKVDLTPLTFGKAPAVGQRVAVIGFPFDYSIPSQKFAQQFAGASGEKHAMPGAVVRAPGKTWAFDYDCFTAVGTSGGPVVNVQTGAVVGMHVVAKPSDEGFKIGAAIEMSRLAKLL
jgi:V8-like Glu-specific endopeptidase